MVITLYAGILGLIYIALSIFVIQGHFKHQVDIGDGGQDNFIEYVLFALILIFLVEQEGVSEIIIHLLGVALILGCIIHSIGLYHKFGTLIRRSSGVILTFFVIIIAAFLCLKAYFIF